MAKNDNRRKYTKEFKLDVVKEHIEGKTLTSLSKKYTIPASTLGTWFATMKGEVMETMKKEKEEEKAVEEDGEYTPLDLNSLEELERLKSRNKELELLVEDRNAEVKAYEEKLNQLPRDFKDVNAWIEKVEELTASLQNKEADNKRLEKEVIKLHEILIMIKDDARREIRTLKDAIVILAKPYEDEE